MRTSSSGARLFVGALVAFLAGPSFAQQCSDSCSADRCAARATCETDYQTCMSNANGDPVLEASCAEQLTACNEAADNSFISCASNCPISISDEPCLYDAALGYGLDQTACNDQYWACTYYNPPEVCEVYRQSCRQAARAVYEASVLACATSCIVSVEHKSWSNVKSLYKE